MKDQLLFLSREIGFVVDRYMLLLIEFSFGNREFASFALQTHNRAN